MKIGIDIDDTISNTYDVVFNYAQKYTLEELKRDLNISNNKSYYDHNYTESIHGWNKLESVMFWEKYYKEILHKVRPKAFAKEYLDKIAEDFIRSKGAIPSEKGYPSGIEGVMDFPGSICASINDEVIHGIPSKRAILKEGDIISFDLTVYKNGFHGDCARTYIVGKASNEAKRLVDITKQAFFEGIKYAVKGNRVGDISHAIGEFVEKNGYNVVREFQGHGIGREMHEDPGIPNYGKPGRGIRLEPGMTLAVEPMVIAGGPNILELDDGWGIITADGTRAAHYENTILITEKEPKILTIL